MKMKSNNINVPLPADLLMKIKLESVRKQTTIKELVIEALQKAFGDKKID
jgi:hypothetical protein